MYIQRKYAAVPKMRKDMACLKDSIHAPGLGRYLVRTGEGSQHDVGQGHAEPHHGEAEHDAQRGLEHGGADGLPQERGAARGGNDGGQGAGPEGAGIAFLCWSSPPIVVALTPISKTPNMLSPRASISPSRQKFTHGFSNQNAQLTIPSAPRPSQKSPLNIPGPAGEDQSNMFAFRAIRMAVMIQKEIMMPSTKVREWASTFFFPRRPAGQSS